MEGLLLAVAAIIVTFNSEAVIGACLDALTKMAPHVKAVVVDNASVDRTLEVVRERAHVSLIANRENRGFAGAVNQGVAATDEKFLLVLNPDANLITAVDELIFSTEKFGLSAGKLVDLNGTAQHGFTIRRLPTAATLVFEMMGINRLWPSNPVNRKYRYLDRDLDRQGPVEQPAGAFLMFRRDVWKTLAGFDERFHPVWFEDVDFCNRALAGGFQIDYVPSVQAVHEGAHSVGRLTHASRAVFWCVSLIRYAAKHFQSAGYRAVCLAVVLSSFPRMVARMIQDRSLQSVTTYRKIVWFAGLCLFSPRESARGGKF